MRWSGSNSLHLGETVTRFPVPHFAVPVDRTIHELYHYRRKCRCGTNRKKGQENWMRKDMWYPLEGLGENFVRQIDRIGKLSNGAFPFEISCDGEQGWNAHSEHRKEKDMGHREKDRP